jgi:hypothetical protein
MAQLTLDEAVLNLISHPGDDLIAEVLADPVLAHDTIKVISSLASASLLHASLKMDADGLEYRTEMVAEAVAAGRKSGALHGE